MRKWLIERYVVSAILPYFLFSLILLTCTLLTQQTMRFAELLGDARTPLSLALEVWLGLLPNLLVFTIPMAMLVGTATGISRMVGDGELVSLRAAGLGTVRILTPVLAFALMVSGLMFYLSFSLAPASARGLRDATIRAALFKLESPVEPRQFFTGAPGKVIYVGEGDEKEGRWKRVFIFWRDTETVTRLITANGGQLDFSNKHLELVLQDVSVITLDETIDPFKPKIFTEISSTLRIRDDRLNARREELMRRLDSETGQVEELNLQQLIQRSREAGTDDKLRDEASLALHKKLSLCMAPLLFSLFGAGMSMRIKRGGRAYGIFLSIASMIIYYLLSLGAEHAVRAGWLAPHFGGWLAFGFSLFVTLLVTSGLFSLSPGRAGRLLTADLITGKEKDKTHATRKAPHLGLLDRSLFKSLTGWFLGTLWAMTFIFLTFTLFELFRFASREGLDWPLILRYLLFLLPMVFVALAPMAALLASLIVYALMVRRGEAISWWASGRSTFRLAIPCMLFAVAVGAATWYVQEAILPGANRVQNELRGRIRKGITRDETGLGRRWMTNPDSKRIYSYEVGAGGEVLLRPALYELDDEGVHLERVVYGASGSWTTPNVLRVEDAKVLQVELGGATRFSTARMQELENVESVEAFKPQIKRSGELDTRSLSAYLKRLKTGGQNSEVRTLSVDLEARRAAPAAPLIMALLGPSLAMFFGRRGTVASLCAAIFTGLAYWGASSAFQQMGYVGYVPSGIAAWSSHSIFLLLGVYLLSKAPT